MILNSCSHLFYFPDSYLYSDPKQFKIVYENIFFKSQDGTKLHGWYLQNKEKAVPSKGLILYFHGNAQNISAHYISIAWLTKEGYDVFAFDYRGYGLSKGQPHQRGVHEDSLAALNLAHKRFKKEGHNKFIVYGQSLGGIISLRALKDFKERKDIDLYVMDSTFLSYQDLAAEKLRDSGVLWILNPLGYLLVSDEYSPYKYAPEFDRPTLVIHGVKDTIIPLRFGEEIYHRLRSKRDIWKIKEGGHIDGFFVEKKRYRRKFLQYLSEL